MMVGEQPARGAVRASGRPGRAAVHLSLLLLLSGVVYFAVESLEPEQPIVDLSMVIFLGTLALALIWIVVGERRSRPLD